jgi:hypothetical protein
MGLLNKLQQGASNLTPFDGATPAINPLSTQQSKLHANYSVAGQDQQAVNTNYQQYLDGTNNMLPMPSQLDLNGTIPTLAPSGQALPYSTNAPE